MKAMAATAATALGLLLWVSPTIQAAPNVVTIPFTIDDMGNVTTAPLTKVSPKDQILFTFTNDYASARDVFVCALQEGNKVNSPWKDCSPADPPAYVDKPFTVKSGVTAATQCTVHYPWFKTKKFCVFVEAGAAGVALKCPAAGEECPKGRRVSELALEVDP